MLEAYYMSTCDIIIYNTKMSQNLIPTTEAVLVDTTQNISVGVALRSS